MAQPLSDLVGRREVLKILGAGTVVARAAVAATPAPFAFSGIDHIILPAADSKKSLAFYARVFGNTILKDNHGSNHHVKLGPNYVTLVPAGQGRDPLAKGHFCLGIQNYQMANVKQALDQTGIQAREVAEAGLMVVDPDGIPIQLWAEGSWSQLSRTASPVSLAATGEPRIRPTQINHLLLAVPDPEKSAPFYERILGSPFTRSANPQRIWFRAGRDRVGLSPLADLTTQSKDQANGEHITSGLEIGLDHVGLVAPFDRDALTKELLEAGAKMLPRVLTGPDAAAIDFREVNGFRLQVTPPPQPKA
jgi:catechol 2,3-dioxygenase-like lactoylglutathione lyase family enzyme